MHPLHIIRTLSLGLLLLATLPAAAQTTTLDSLPQESQDEISRICLPVQFREGASAYRNCVQAELQLQSSGDTNNMAKLSFDDKYAVQQACAAAGGQSSSAYQSCVSNQISELNSIPAPVFDNVSEDELYVVQQSCFNAQSKQGAARYRQCLNAELQTLSTTQAADTSQLDMLKKNALQLRCSANASTAAQYRECVTVEFESIAGTAPTLLSLGTAARVVNQNTAKPRAPSVSETVASVAEREIIEPIASAATMSLPRNINPQRETADTTVQEQPRAQTDTNTNDQPTLPEAVSIEEVSTAAPRVISRPNLVKTLAEKQRAEAQGIELEETAPEIDVAPTAAATDVSATTVSKPNALWQKFLDTLASLDGIGWLIIAGVLALPALLLGLFSLIRRVKQPMESPEHPATVAAQRMEAEPGIKTRMLRHERDAEEMFGEREEQRLPNPDETTDPMHDAVTRMATKDEQLATAKQATPSYAWQSAFGHWLMQQPESDRMELCIEFLIYWVAYGDERYAPELKKRLFTASDLNTHDQIKRWVLKQDVFAFSDVIGWLRTNATQEQLDQAVALTMTLLVTENNVTPVQNTLFRFLSDAFNIGSDDLEARFEHAFGHTMPAMPRPDKDAWWAKQAPESVKQWNSRTMASRPELEQMMARLGLAPGFNDGQVINAFRRAARRCHPDRFTALGERERALAEQRFVIFEEARDKLLGVSV